MRPDAWFLDGDVPDLGPESVIAALRATPALASVPVYLMTGSDVSPSLAQKVQGVLVKPFTLEEVLQRLGSASRVERA